MVTRQVSVDHGRRVVVKRYAGAGDGPAREWRALTLLAEHAPGLAPEPILADLAGEPAVIEMSLLPGQALGGRPLTADQESALVRAVGQLWQSVPVSQVTLLAGEVTDRAQLELVHHVGEMAAQGHDPGDDTVTGAARAAGLDWMAWAVSASGGLRPGGPGQSPGEPGLPHVFGQGAADLADFVWDGERVRIVDFEYSGVSDRAFELAIFVEHPSAWSGADLDAGRYLAAFDLTAAERARLADCRRLAALYWLLRPGLRSDPNSGNPAGALRQQAERLLSLL